MDATPQDIFTVITPLILAFIGTVKYFIAWRSNQIKQERLLYRKLAKAVAQIQYLKKSLQAQKELCVKLKKERDQARKIAVAYKKKYNAIVVTQKLSS